jgi:hypothetical protein
MISTINTNPVSVLTSTRAFWSASLNGMSGVAARKQPAVAKRTRVSAFGTGLGHEVYGPLSVTTLIPSSDVVVFDGAQGFRTWSPPV